MCHRQEKGSQRQHSNSPYSDPTFGCKIIRIGQFLVKLWYFYCCQVCVLLTKFGHIAQKTLCHHEEKRSQRRHSNSPYSDPTFGCKIIGIGQFLVKLQYFYCSQVCLFFPKFRFSILHYEVSEVFLLCYYGYC